MRSITDEQEKLIAKYTRREMKPEELFIFSVILCDNQIDRDGERFSKSALEKLAELYLGKTGVFDHEPRAENQTARIFDTQVTHEPKDDGTSYYALKAWVYMMQSEKNADLILEIDGGIKKEVSVGCAVSEVLCSVCGQNQKNRACSHTKGAFYDNQICHHLLVNPTDAYEWSFVVVPAQPLAGVTKTFSRYTSPPLVQKIHRASKEIVLEKEELQSLQKHLNQLSFLAEKGQEYSDKLKQEVLKTSAVVQPHMDLELLKELCDTASFSQLQKLHKTYLSMAEERPYQGVQLGGISDPDSHTSFQI